ncbi:hypothetical protein MMMB2_1799 [Mycobacterium marinum MB2]|nr:hypothetical protein MMMB2_1799 [Mycobacterium marinum MB2]
MSATTPTIASPTARYAGVGWWGSGSPRRMARSACCQRSSPIPLVRIASVASTTPSTWRAPWTASSGTSCTRATAAARSPNAVRCQARKVRSLARVNR